MDGANIHQAVCDALSEDVLPYAVPGDPDSEMLATRLEASLWAAGYKIVGLLDCDKLADPIVAEGQA
jgi:hypothetical protein